MFVTEEPRLAEVAVQSSEKPTMKALGISVSCRLSLTYWWPNTPVVDLRLLIYLLCDELSVNKVLLGGSTFSVILGAGLQPSLPNRLGSEGRKHFQTIGQAVGSVMLS